MYHESIANFHVGNMMISLNRAWTLGSIPMEQNPTEASWKANQQMIERPMARQPFFVVKSCGATVSTVLQWMSWISDHQGHYFTLFQILGISKAAYLTSYRYFRHTINADFLSSLDSSAQRRSSVQPQGLEGKIKKKKQDQTNSSIRAMVKLDWIKPIIADGHQFIFLWDLHSSREIRPGLKSETQVVVYPNGSVAWQRWFSKAKILGCRFPTGLRLQGWLQLNR